MTHPDFQRGNPSDPDVRDSLWDLLGVHASGRPHEPSPWFVVQTVAKVRGMRQVRSRMGLLVRWMLPLPVSLAAALSMYLAFHQEVWVGSGAAPQPASFVSSDEDFGQDLDLLASS